MTRRILFVDDEPNVLQGLQRMLRQMGSEWEMVFADSGASALARMAEQPFDVIVSDMRMPGMNGAELLHEVMRRYPTTVRLVLSGHADRDLVAQCVGVAHQYISKPCDHDQLKSMIRNACLLSGDLVSGEVKRIIGSIDRLPSVPALYRRLKAALEDEDVNTQAIGDIVQQDMGMTAKILKLVNSAFFGLRRTIETPHEAVAYLGIETVKTLVLANGIFGEAIHFKTQAFTLDELWHHSLSVASGAKSIANEEHAERSIQEEAFVGGILHDVGILVLAANFPGSYDRVADLVIQKQLSIPTAEQLEFGVTHAEVGAYLLGLWGIPAPILRIVSMHHRPTQSQETVGQETGFSALLAVHAADVLSGRQGHHPLFETGKMNEPFLVQAGFQTHIEAWRDLLTCPQAL
jgi:HD-like signal output (HDOD) protein/CheY-like chemotaxis protein